LSAQVPPTKGTADLRDSSVEHAISAAATRSYMFRDMFQTCLNHIQILVRLPYPGTKSLGKPHFFTYIYFVYLA
jgi:hypothetical protein